VKNHADRWRIIGLAGAEGSRGGQDTNRPTPAHLSVRAAPDPVA
jgi:hypothetical protein